VSVDSEWPVDKQISGDNWKTSSKGLRRNNQCQAAESTNSYQLPLDACSHQPD
jgi:hypothetical protein